MVLAIVLLLLLVVVIFTIPKVQSYVAQKFTSEINTNYNTNIAVESLQIQLNGNIELKKVYVEDHRKDTLVYMERFSTSILSLASFWENSVKISNTKIDDFRFNLVHYEDEEVDNLLHFINLFSDSNSVRDSLNYKPFQLEADFVLATQVHFSTVDYRRKNPNTFSIKNALLHADNLLINGSHVDVHVRRLNGQTGRDFIIEDLETQLSYTPTQLFLDGLSLTTNLSKIQADIIMQYEPGDFSDFNNKVQLDAKFSYASLSTSDLAKFYNEFGYGEKLNFNGHLVGVMNDFDVENIYLTGMRNSKIISKKLKFKNILDDDKPFVLEGNFGELQTDYSDLANLLPRLLGNTLPDELSRFGQLNIKGYTLIRGANLKSDFSAITSIGDADVNLNFTKLDSQKDVKYEGNLSFKEIRLDKMLLDDKYGQVTFDLKVKGKGFRREYLDTELIGNIDKIEINKYTYQNISVDGKLKEPEFNGNFSIKDPNMNLDFSGLVDLSEEESLYNFAAKINYINLNKTNLYTRGEIAEIAGDVKINMRGKDLNDLVGNIDLKNFIYQNEYELVEFEDLELTARFEDKVRYIEVNSPDVIKGKLSGVFELTELPSITLSAFQNLYYRKNPDDFGRFAYIDFEFDVYSKIVEAIFPKIRFEAGTSFEGSIVANDNYFRLNFTSPEIEAYGNIFSEIDLRIDNKDPNENTALHVGKIKTSLYETSDIHIINEFKNDTLFVEAKLKGGKNEEDDFNLKVYQTSTDADELIFGLADSQFSIKNYDWQIRSTDKLHNKIIISENFQQFEFDSIVAFHEESYIKLNGRVRDSTFKDVSLNFNKLKLESITPSIDSLALKGEVNGLASLFQNEGDYTPNINFKISDFEVNKTKLGVLSLFADGDKDFENFTISADLKQENDTLLKANGRIFKLENEQKIDAVVETKDLDMSIFSPLGGIVISDLRGYLNGAVSVKEKLTEPALEGTLYLKDGGMKIPYLNIDFDLIGDTEINVLKSVFVFTGVEIEDTKYQSNARLDGLVRHANFIDWELDLNIGGTNFVALDTAFEEGKLYYGTAFITGNAEIVGPIDDLVINVDARTNKNTLFRIPLDDSEFLSDASFIYFLTEEDKEIKAEGKSLQLREVKGLSLNFDLDITEEAEVEIVVDKSSGSSLRGRGTGNLLIEIDTNGKFNMFGDFEAKEGIYDFKYAGLVNKKFNVVSGGTLTWNGDPLQANMNVEAIYKTQANPAMILENPSINRDIPVEVSISLKGELVQPDINFDINYPNLSSIVKSELDYRIQGRDNVELQAISLVAQGTFYNIDGLGGQGAITGNLVEGASGLIDKLFSDDEGKFKVGLDYTQAQRIPDQNQTGDRVGMSFQTQISDRILINGRFGVPVGGTTESFIFGDVEVNLLLNESGSLRANAFNRESDIQFIGEELAYTQGVGISYAVDFQNFRDLLNRIIKNQAIRQPQTEKESTEIDESQQKKSVLPDYIDIPNISN